MKKLQTLGILLIIILAVIVVKFFLNFPIFEISVLGTVLSIASILFSLLIGFFISILWSRYTEVRALQGERASSGISLIELARHFYKDNSEFKKDFIKRVEKSAIADEFIFYNEGHLETPYYVDIAKSFDLLKIKNPKDEVYLQAMMASYQKCVETTERMDILYKERLSFSEWLILIVLSLIITFSVLFLDPSNLLYQVIVIVFPPIIFLAMSIIYDLDRLASSRGLVTLEPNQVIFDYLGVRRFYKEDDKKFSGRKKLDFRTEADLRGEAKEVMNEIKNKRKG